MSIPKRHHFLPQFFLDKWCNDETKKLYYFHKSYKSKLVEDHKVSKQVGFEKFLYSIKNLPVEKAQEVEINFFSKVDDKAADALVAILEEENISFELQEHWWQFVTTLLTRMPSDVIKFASFLDKIAEITLPNLAKVAGSIPELAGKSDGIRQNLNIARKHFTDEAIKSLSRQMSNEKLLKYFNSFHWRVISTEGAEHELLTSDRPAQFYGEDNDLFLWVPIGPHCLFVASNNNNVIFRLGKFNINELVKELNKLTVGNANICVIARSTSQRGFISKYMGNLCDPSLLDRLISEAEALLPLMALGIDEGHYEQKNEL